MNNFVNKIRKMTENNNHTEALIAVAKVIGATKYVHLLGAVKTIRDIEGHNPLSDYTYNLYKEVMELAKEKLPKEEYEALYNAL